MARLRPWSVSALIGWTLFTWGNRIPLLWASDTQTTAEKVRGTVPIGLFLLLAVVAAVGHLRSSDGIRDWGRTAALGLAAWSTAYWVVRLPFILANDHPVPFKVVHSVLATVAVGLSVWVLRQLRAARPVARTPEPATV